MLSAAILAGGRARRFGGADKASLLVDGRTILDRQLEALVAIADDIMLVDRVREERLRDTGRGVRVIHDRVTDCGPLGGLDAALAVARHPIVIALGCDMPFVTAPFLAYVASTIGDADAAVPRTERGYHPVCAAYNIRCHLVVERLLAAGRYSMMALLDDLDVREIGAKEIEGFGAPDRLLANVNTPDELARTAAVAAHES